jgi:class 3 adenylate cyclase
MSSAALASRLELLRAQAPLRPETLDRFAQFLETAPEEALFRMSPLRFAAEVRVPEQEAVDLFLRATHAGILEFTWGVLCPGCGAFLATPAALRSLQGERRCRLCRIPVFADDDNIEVAFTVAPMVRRLRFHQQETLDLRRDLLSLVFSQSREVPDWMARGNAAGFVDSVLLPPGGEGRLNVRLEPGGYSLSAPMHHLFGGLHVSEDGEASTAALELREGSLLPESVRLRAGDVTVRVHNHSGVPVRVALSRKLAPPESAGAACDAWAPVLRPYLNGKRLVTNQTFRELFRAESIPSEGGLEFKSMTVLFTDLKGSTELYERIGDFRAWGLVREHFRVLRDIIAARGGCMVKTIGDAVMASFAEPTPALEAATAMTREVRRVGREGTDLQLKVGLHTGPCIAVELNERLDYFGQTVNLAARVQGVASADEIAITEPVWAAPGAQDVIRAAALQASRERALLKGVEGETTIYRLR